MQNHKCPGGEIGRRTVFRSQRLQGCDGSNPFLGTLLKEEQIGQFVLVCSSFDVFEPYSPCTIIFFQLNTAIQHFYERKCCMNAVECSNTASVASL
jgi:hypothetical protein